MPVPYWAGHYIGLNFKEHGRYSCGLDCWGLVRLVLRERFDILVPSYSFEYEHTCASEEIGTLIQREAQKWQKVEPKKEQLGDVIILRMRGQPMHVGLVLGDQQMIHIERGINSTIERYNGLRWKDRIVAFFRHKGMHQNDETE